MRGRTVIASGDPSTIRRLASVPAIISQLVAEVRALKTDRDDPDDDANNDYTRYQRLVFVFEASKRLILDFKLGRLPMTGAPALEAAVAFVEDLDIPDDVPPGSETVPSSKTRCAQCFEYKECPWRDDDGYICVKCLEAQRDAATSRAEKAEEERDVMSKIVEAVEGAEKFVESTGSCPECGHSNSPHKAAVGQDHNPSCFVALMLHHLAVLRGLVPAENKYANYGK